MGMAASQARLLALTSRMHDIELRAQNLESQKLSLATQEDAAYQKYCDALDATKIQVGKQDLSTGKVSYVDANFQTVCGYQENSVRQYSLINNITGKVIVTQEIKDLYEQYGGDSYSFAWAAMGFDNNAGWGASGGGPYDNYGFLNNQGYSGLIDLVGVGTASNFDPIQDNLKYELPPGSGDYVYGGYGSDVFMTEAEFAVFINHYGEDAPLTQAYDELIAVEGNPNSTISERKAAFKTFRDALYGNSEIKAEIIKAMTQLKTHPFDPTDTDFSENQDAEYADKYTANKFSYYQNLWEQINQAGGCETIDEQYVGGDEGTEWFNNMVSSGLVSIYMLNTDKDKWEVTTIATSVGNNYLQEVNDEEKAKKAEAEYHHELKIINRKDTKFDTALKKLETEENACKTEIESIKKVKDENIDRTFNLFS